MLARNITQLAGSHRTRHVQPSSALNSGLARIGSTATPLHARVEPRPEASEAGSDHNETALPRARAWLGPADTESRSEPLPGTTTAARGSSYPAWHEALSGTSSQPATHSDMTSRTGAHHRLGAHLLPRQHDPQVRGRWHSRHPSPVGSPLSHGAPKSPNAASVRQGHLDGDARAAARSIAQLPPRRQRSHAQTPAGRQAWTGRPARS